MSARSDARFGNVGVAMGLNTDFLASPTERIFADNSPDSGVVVMGVSDDLPEGLLPTPGCIL